MSDKQKPRKQQFKADKGEQAKKIQQTKNIRTTLRVEHKRAGMKGK